ncbi:MAG: hypothetical protein KF729_16825 [Sandaracinaceae bacterium]|nr:hypothetical protein [Sandaracinaceae bacterium]
MSGAKHGGRWIAFASAVALGVVGPACGSSQQGAQTGEGRSQAMSGSDQPVDDQGRCDTNAADREVSEYDTTGDGRSNVRRVFRRVGQPPMTRLVLACREADLNGDGVKDVVRYYNDEGRPLREEADRDFDGRMDMITFFQDGRIVRQEQDTNGDGRVDTKIFFERGRMVRTERDLAGRSTAARWQPDRWEYFEDGRMVRMGTDIDGDGNVDRWDRDQEWSEQRRAQESALDASDDDGIDDGDASDAE